MLLLDMWSSQSVNNIFIITHMKIDYLQNIIMFAYKILGDVSKHVIPNHNSKYIYHNTYANQVFVKYNVRIQKTRRGIIE